MTFDGNVTLGALLNMAVMILGGFYFVWDVKGRLFLLIQETNLRHTVNTEKFNGIDKKLDVLVSTTVELAKQELRLNHLDSRLQELSNRIENFAKASKRKITR